MNIYEELEKKKYDFLNKDDLSSKIILMTLGGSRAYGTNIDGSDIDVRGIALNTSREILLGEDFGQVVDENTDTVIYSIQKYMGLLVKSNPSVLELLGTKNYIYLSETGQLLVANKTAFLSKQCAVTYGGFIRQIINRVYKNSNENTKLGKEMMHIVRLYYTVFDILEKGQLNIYRPENKELLAIRKGKYIDPNTGRPTVECTEMINQLEKRLQYAKENTSLPELPNKKYIEQLRYEINKSVVVGDLAREINFKQIYQSTSNGRKIK